VLSHAVSFGVAVIASAVASVTGFGIGSFLTPTVAVWTDTKLAVAAVAIPHFIGTAQRFWMLRRSLDRRILLGFGIASAAGALAGALLHSRASGHFLAVLLGALLVLAGVSELTGWMRRVRWTHHAAWGAGALSGTLGGLVGSQGGIRSASMLGFDVPKESFVATATAIGLFVDFARLPVYIAAEGPDLLRIWPLIVTTTLGVVLGTAVGARILSKLPQQAFRRVVASLLIVLGVFLIVRR